MLMFMFRRSWLEKILLREMASHLAFFGKNFDLTDFANTLTRYGESKIRFWQKLGLEPAFLPKVTMSQDAKFPGWKIKPEDWFYQKVAEGKIFRQVNNELIPVKEVGLEGITVLVDKRVKPKYNKGRQMYRNDNLLGPIIEELRNEGKIAKYTTGLQSSRFGISSQEWEDWIKPLLAKKMGLEHSRVRLETVIESNVIAQMYRFRMGDYRTDTFVFYEEEYLRYKAYRLAGGNYPVGHVGVVTTHSRWQYGSIRPIIILS